MLTGVTLLNQYWPEWQKPFLFENVNRHQLLLFLIANLLTGAINLSIDTLHQSDSLAFFILFSYLVVILTASCLLKVKINF